MPTYEYIPVSEDEGCEVCRVGLEVLQSMSEDPLAKCPDCGVAVQRTFSGARVNTRPSEKTQMSDKNLKRLGFKKFEKSDGGYQQTV